MTDISSISSLGIAQNCECLSPYSNRRAYWPYLMWSLPLLFFTYQFILRLWPGLTMQAIMGQFAIDAGQFGIIAGSYYLGYAGMQIPVAILLECYGARATVAAFALLCGGATLLFTYSSHWYLACIARFLVGAGSAAGFLSVSKVVSEWFPKIQYTKLIGFSFTVGLMGAIYGGRPINYLIEIFAWKNVALWLAIFAIFVGALALLILRAPKNPAEDLPASQAFEWGQFKTILSSPFLWALAVANLLMVGALEGFSDVWGIPYLMKAYVISKSEAATLVSFIFIGMLFGGPVLALLTKKFKTYTILAFCGFGLGLAFLALLFSPHYHWHYLAFLLFTIGLLCCYQVIVFAAGADLVSSSCLGLTIAFLNGMNMLGGSFFHSLIGALIDWFWLGAFDAAGVKLYNLETYRMALVSIPLTAFLGGFILCGLGWQKRKSAS